MYRLAIFDFDGTLADSAEWFLSSLNDVADRFGFRRVSDAEISMLRHRSNREIVDYLGIKAWKLPLIARHMRAMVARDADRIPMFEGAASLLAKLRDGGVATALVTSNAEANARRILGSAASLVDHYACGASLFGKAGHLRSVLRRAGVVPHQAIAIGDETRDIEAARDVGVVAGAVLWGYAAPNALARFAPDHSFASFEDIKKLLLPGTL